MKLDFPYLVIDHRIGTATSVFMSGVTAAKFRLRQKPGTRPFTDAYTAALDALEQAAPQVRTECQGAPAGTFGWLAATYFASVEFKALPSLTARSTEHHRGLPARAA